MHTGKLSHIAPIWLTLIIICKYYFHLVTCGGGQGGGRPGEKGAGGVWEAGEEGVGSGIPKVAGSRRKREKLRNIAQYFAIEKMQRGGSQKIQGGNRD